MARGQSSLRANATFRKWEVFLLDNGATNSFLPMSATKFVTDLRGQAIQERKSNLKYKICIAYKLRPD